MVQAQKRSEVFHEPSSEHAAPMELGNDEGGVAAIDMALLWSFAKRFNVPRDVRSRTRVHEPWGRNAAVASSPWRSPPVEERWLFSLSPSVGVRGNFGLWTLGFRLFCTYRFHTGFIPILK